MLDVVLWSLCQNIFGWISMFGHSFNEKWCWHFVWIHPFKMQRFNKHFNDFKWLFVIWSIAIVIVFVYDQYGENRGSNTDVIMPWNAFKICHSVNWAATTHNVPPETFATRQINAICSSFRANVGINFRPDSNMLSMFCSFVAQKCFVFDAIHLWPCIIIYRIWFVCYLVCVH